MTPFDEKKIKSLILGNQSLLIKCCQHSGNIDESSIRIILLSSVETMQRFQLKIGVFFREVLTGCACSDDPLQAIMYENGYCELHAELNKTTALISF
ncbi:hypothetical protein THERMOT_2286 [Bathymodiolus thermophilus thioautotrophic gill symbiont]|uniref:Uncharacterized protein n=1 Tax=Bathymodiolus thermophilus thioautotrophic gill symbiont TaxID=2360 RepID=A0A1J5UKX7_9GAMM|nr:hypothetical protein [Bathymodiolus thermophilus thioautotrophic gill symbiont]OIR24911.1 hypothetical protein BGC33_12120 [Bathymodiolus thermophilus thioautotrophic gill symbiont]CAB5506174.1 hypothetical protein THERMOT_2286 [Bathymodiolus thermophilus thioautotrophic gill symbiont]